MIPNILKNFGSGCYNGHSHTRQAEVAEFNHLRSLNSPSLKMLVWTFTNAAHGTQPLVLFLLQKPGECNTFSLTSFKRQAFQVMILHEKYKVSDEPNDTKADIETVACLLRRDHVILWTYEYLCSGLRTNFPNCTPLWVHSFLLCVSR